MLEPDHCIHLYIPAPVGGHVLEVKQSDSEDGETAEIEAEAAPQGIYFEVMLQALEE